MIYLINKIKNNRTGYSLVEILAALAIISTVLIVSVNSIFSSSKVSVNNEIADRANTMSARVIELVKSAQDYVTDCNTGGTIALTAGKSYTVGKINLSSSVQSNNVCLKAVSSTTLNTTCDTSSPYYTAVTFNFGKDPGRKEIYCLQVKIDNITGSTYKKLTVRSVFDDLSNDNLVRTYYGFITQ